MLGFLHTADLHVATFSALTQSIHQDRRHVHVVDETLLADARQVGVDDPELRHRIRARLDELAASGVDTIVCTCSSISGAAEELATSGDPRVIRIDRPLMTAAAAIGGRIGLVVAVESTIVLSRQLLDEAISISGRPASVTEVVAADAWEKFEAGDLAGYHRTLAQAVDEIASELDVVVLAQASMLPVVDLVTTDLPVLCAPRLAVEAA